MPRALRRPLNAPLRMSTRMCGAAAQSYRPTRPTREPRRASWPLQSRARCRSKPPGRGDLTCTHRRVQNATRTRHTMGSHISTARGTTPPATPTNPPPCTARRCGRPHAALFLHACPTHVDHGPLSGRSVSGRGTEVVYRASFRSAPSEACHAAARSDEASQPCARRVRLLRRVRHARRDKADV